MIEMGSTKGNNRKTLWEPLSVDCLRVLRWHDGGSGQRWRRNGGDSKREKEIQRSKEGKGKERAAQLPLQSKWSILSFLLRVHGCPQRWWWLCRRRAHRPLLWPRLSSMFLRKQKNKPTSRKTNTEQPCMVFVAWGEKTTSEDDISNAT